MPDTPTPRKRGRPRTVDRDKVVQDAMLVYWQEGPFTLSVNALCRRIGVSKPALYRLFDSEDGLMRAALLRHRTLTVEPMLGLLAADLPFATTLERLLGAMAAEAPTPAGCLFTRLRLARARLGPSTLAALEAIEAERLAALTARADRAQATGEAPATVSAGFVAHFLDSQFSSLLIQRAAGTEPERALAEARFAVQGLLTTGP